MIHIFNIFKTQVQDTRSFVTENILVRTQVDTKKTVVTKNLDFRVYMNIYEVLRTVKNKPTIYFISGMSFIENRIQIKQRRNKKKYIIV